mmetsp:Transcript_10545/g.17232  ORF Transcript_10545/g.17232 Transcript_10545/m.17232 type:complete len:206 (+) Transcript_10545:1400-2017(+)
MLRIHQTHENSRIQYKIAMTALDHSSLGIDLRFDPCNVAGATTERLRYCRAPVRQESLRCFFAFQAYEASVGTSWTLNYLVCLLHVSWCNMGSRSDLRLSGRYSCTHCDYGLSGSLVWCGSTSNQLFELCSDRLAKFRGCCTGGTARSWRNFRIRGARRLGRRSIERLLTTLLLVGLSQFRPSSALRLRHLLPPRGTVELVIHRN